MQEFLRRQQEPSSQDIVDRNFPIQARFVEDDAGLLAVRCTRRAGKSYGLGLKLYRAARNHPGSSQLYISLTRISAKAIMMKDVLKVIDRKFDLRCEFNKSELTVTLPNGSVIYLMGMDSSDEEKEKALGQKFKQVVIDEAGSFRRDLKEIVYGVLKPACADLRGQICIAGSPQPLTSGLFYDVVEGGSEPGWSKHRWTAFDNPYIRERWQEEIAELTASNPRIVETPSFKRNFLGEYVVDTERLVYRYQEETNKISKKDLPLLVNFVLGIDLGFNDASAFSVLGYDDQAKKLYVVETYKESGLIITEVARWIKHFENKYNPYKMVIDNASKQAVEELKQRYGIPLHPADKSGKSDFIEIMNAEYICGNIMVSDSCESLTDEYENLIWDDKREIRQEHPNCENHLCDATLYAWRYCYQYANQPKILAPKKTVDEQADLWLENEIESHALKQPKEWWEK